MAEQRRGVQARAILQIWIQKARRNRRERLKHLSRVRANERIADVLRPNLNHCWDERTEPLRGCRVVRLDDGVQTFKDEMERFFTRVAEKCAEPVVNFTHVRREHFWFGHGQRFCDGSTRANAQRRGQTWG